MDKTKLVILVLVLLVIIAFMALGAGAYRDSQEGTDPPRSYQAGGAMKAVEKVTGAFRSKFELSRMRGCNRSGSSIPVSGSCEIVVSPGPARPSRFRLSPAGGTVHVCFAMTRPKLMECLAPGIQPDPEELEKPADFTVASDSAYLHLGCSGPSSCSVTVTAR